MVDVWQLKQIVWLLQPTVDYGNACTSRSNPWLGKCDYYTAYEMLNHFYGGNLVVSSPIILIVIRTLWEKIYLLCISLNGDGNSYSNYYLCIDNDEHP
jgi:hypothetical protein